MKLAEWQKNKPECTSPFKASHPSVSADMPLARTDHTVEPSTEIRQGLLPREGGLCSYVTVGETTGKGKETGPSWQSAPHPSSHPHSCMCSFSSIELAAFSSFRNFAHVWVLPDTFAFTHLPFCYSRAHSLWIPELLLTILLISNKVFLSPSIGNYEQVTFVNFFQIKFINKVSFYLLFLISKFISVKWPLYL